MFGQAEKTRTNAETYESRHLMALMEGQASKGKV
jgi:hypothetical protein